MTEYISANELEAQAKKEFDEIEQKIKAAPLSPKDRMAIPLQEMPVAEPKKRAREMGEVALGYTKEMAINEANRCLQCKNEPCVAGCPVGIAIPQFIGESQKGDCKSAVDTIKLTNLLPAICGRVCPQEKQCQKECTLYPQGW